MDRRFAVQEDSFRAIAEEHTFSIRTPMKPVKELGAPIQASRRTGGKQLFVPATPMQSVPLFYPTKVNEGILTKGLSARLVW